MTHHEIEIITSSPKKRKKTTISSFILPLALIVWPWLALPVIFLLYAFSNLISPPEFIRIILNVVLFVIGFITVIASLPSFFIGILLLIVRSKK